MGARLSYGYCVKALYSIEFKDINCAMSHCRVICEWNGVMVKKILLNEILCGTTTLETSYNKF